MRGVKDAERGRKSALAKQAGSLSVVLRDEFETPFRVYDSATGLLGAGPDESGDGPDAPADEPEWLAEFAAEERSDVSVLPSGMLRLTLSLHDDEGRPTLVAVGELSPLARSPGDAARERTRVKKWLRSVHERLRQACRSQVRHRERIEAPRDRDAQSSAAWEGVLRLEQLLHSLRIDKEPTHNRKRILRSFADLIGAQTVAWVPSRNDEPVVIEGERLMSPWDFSQLGALLSQSPEGEEQGYLIRNDFPAAGWAGRFPRVENLLAMPLKERGFAGWVIALNKKELRPTPQPQGAAEPGDDRASNPAATLPFRRVDAALMTPFAALVGSFARASQRYNYLKDLLVGLTRSLTAAIDAKDAYTFGHSERVARVAVEIGRELGLQEDELSDIYLAGLLHDIGKIGIRDSVLGKPGPLTPDEFEHIKEHVKIGYRILSDLKPIAHLMPGVLYHHERFDGKGYPEGLKGSAIPFLARILAVADSFDAMSTSRPYRDAMPTARAEAILVEGAGTQWDKTVIEAFVQCKARIHAIRQRGVGESLCNALDDALRKGADQPEQPSHAAKPL